MEENRLWKANWIWAEIPSSSEENRSHECIYFRRTFDVQHPKHCRLQIDVSADSRYRLYLNGKSISTGPCKGDGHTHYYETIDLTEKLKSGENVLAAKVIHFSKRYMHSSGLAGPASVWRSDLGGFILEGVLRNQAGKAIQSLHTDQQWKVLRDTSLSYQKESFTLCVGGTEQVEGSFIPYGWEQVEYDDDLWQAAVCISSAQDEMYGGLTPWQLTPRPIPAMYEEDKDFKNVVRQSCDWVGKKLSPGQRFWVEWDAGEITKGYLNIAVSGGRGSVCKLLCSECYEGPIGSNGERNKSVRDDPKGKQLLGDQDIYRVSGFGEAGGKHEIYEPFWLRSFRFVRLEIEVGEEPLELHRCSYRETGYPLQIQGQFRCSDPSFTPLWEISLNTLKRCMYETYEDTPYYEQMQYEMDTRLQILFTYYVSGDDRLARKAIYDFHSSLLPSGMLQSRYPSVWPQVIPGFALFWIMMVYDHYMFFGDDTLVVRYRATIDAVLEWFERRVTDSGLIGQMPMAYWSFVDWVEEWDHNAGAVPASRYGPSTIYNFMVIDALQKAAMLHQRTGRWDTAKEYIARADRIKVAVHQHCWSSQKGLFQDGPGVEEYSQHAQVWAILSRTVEGTKAQQLMGSLLHDASLPAVSYAMSFFMFRAMSQTGMYNESFSLWEMWREQLKLNVTAWVEDPFRQRSDCHGWGAVALYEFPAEILGIQPEQPGYKKIVVAPKPGPLTWAEGTAMTAHGPVHVKWKIEKDNKFRLSIQGPQGIPVRVEMPNGSEHNFLDAHDLHVCL